MVKFKRHLPLLLLAFQLEACLGPQLDADNPYERHMALISLRRKPALIKATIKALSDPDWRVAATASALALKHSLKEIVPAATLLLQMRTFDDQRVEYLLHIVGRLGRKEHSSLVAPYLSHSRPMARIEALRALAIDHLGFRGLETLLFPLTKDKDQQVRSLALEILHHYPQ